MHKSTLWHVLAICFMLILPLAQAQADSYLEVFSGQSEKFGRRGLSDTLGKALHFAQFGQPIAVFLPPYTIYFDISPLGESTYTAALEFHELLPGLTSKSRELELRLDQWQTIDSLTAKGSFFRYSFRITRDTLDIFAPIPNDSLINNESIHFRAWMLRDAYADLKWRMRGSYLESHFDLFRKELKFTRGGKVECFILPDGSNSPAIDINTGVGFDIPHGRFYAVFNSGFDGALPEYTQRLVVYENLGYSARALAAGFARYFLDDAYQAKKLIDKLSPARLKKILLDENPGDIEQADIISGAFVKFLIDKYSMGSFRQLYEKSSAGDLAVKAVYKRSLDDLVGAFIDFERRLKFEMSMAVFFSEMYRGQLWFDRVLEYDQYLAANFARWQYLKRLGACQFYLGQYAESESTYARLVQFHPNDIEAKYLLGQAYLRAGKPGRGMRALNEIAGKFGSAAKTLAEIYLDKGQPDSARPILDKLSGTSDSWTAILKARLAFMSGDIHSSDSPARLGLILSENTISSIPGEGRGYVEAGYCQMLLGDFDAARSDFEAALFIEYRPYYRGAAMLGLGRLGDVIGERAAAVGYYKKVAEQNSGAYVEDLAKGYLDKPFSLK